MVIPWYNEDDYVLAENFQQIEVAHAWDISELKSELINFTQAYMYANHIPGCTLDFKGVVMNGVKCDVSSTWFQLNWYHWVLQWYVEQCRPTNCTKEDAISTEGWHPVKLLSDSQIWGGDWNYNEQERYEPLDCTLRNLYIHNMQAAYVKNELYFKRFFSVFVKHYWDAPSGAPACSPCTYGRKKWIL